MRVYFHKEFIRPDDWQPVEGDLYAFLSDDNGWYRSKLTKISEDKKTVNVSKPRLDTFPPD